MAQLQVQPPAQAAAGTVPVPVPVSVPIPVPVPVPGVPNQFMSTSLYVGDLDPSITEAQLYDVFNQVAPVLSIRVCRDLISRRSLGYAYVNYNTAQEAGRALDLLNFSVINAKPIRIMFSHRDPSIRKSGMANIFIKNLDKSIDNKALHDTFSAFGPILSCKVAVDGNGQSKGYGFVQFEQEEAAQISIEKVNGMLLNDKQVYVGPFVRRQERDLANGASKFNNVYVKNLADATTDDDLKRVFGDFGPISSAVVMRDAEGKSKGFGFVNFENADDAAQAVDALNGKKMVDKEWYVGRAQKKSEREAELRAKFDQERKERNDKYQGVNLYLKNLDDGIDDEKLRELFQGFGTIISCKVMRDPQGHSKGSGFVAFSTAEEANRAKTEMNGRMVANKPIYVALAQKRDERRRYNAAQAQFAPFRIPVGLSPAVASSVPMFHPGPGMGQPVFFGQPPPAFPPQPAGFAYQQQMMSGIRPGGPQMPFYSLPLVQRQPQPQQRPSGGRRGGPGPQQQPQQLMSQQQRPGNRNLRYTQTARNAVDVSPPGLGGVLPVPVEVGGSSDSGVQPLPISALASALASASPDEQRGMLGEQLYPLVDNLEHDHAGKVTGMLLEMDQTEVLHLIESPEALKAKVAEAMDVLRKAKLSADLASFSLNEPLAA